MNVSILVFHVHFSNGGHMSLGHFAKSSTFALTLAFGVVFSGEAFAEADPEKGKKQFMKCAACHAADKPQNKVGPHLIAVVGRKAGSVDGYAYSNDLKTMGEANTLWDEALLDKYLENPKAVAPKGKMSFGGIKKFEDRADLIAYLKTLAAAAQ